MPLGVLGQHAHADVTVRAVRPDCECVLESLRRRVRLPGEAVQLTEARMHHGVVGPESLGGREAGGRAFQIAVAHAGAREVDVQLGASRCADQVTRRDRVVAPSQQQIEHLPGVGVAPAERRFRSAEHEARRAGEPGGHVGWRCLRDQLRVLELPLGEELRVVAQPAPHVALGARRAGRGIRGRRVL